MKLVPDRVRCWSYKTLDWFRFTPVATLLVYKGERVRIYERNVTVLGKVERAPDDATDGDVTFNLRLPSPRKGDTFRHCEVTPCAPASVRDTVRALKVGDVVTVSGDERFDPSHLGGNEGWLEIHPVTGVTVLQTSA